MISYHINYEWLDLLVDIIMLVASSILFWYGMMKGRGGGGGGGGREINQRQLHLLRDRSSLNIGD